jgi:cell division protein FtsN
MKFERGGLMLGLIIGLLIGLAIALGVALWVTKAPVPFVNKVPQRTAEQDAAEAERNKNWDPNAPLAGKPVVPRVPAASAPATAAAAPAAPASAAPAAKAPTRDPAAILAGAPVPAPKASAPAAAAEPRSAKAGADPFIYFVQAGAFQSSDDAEQRRAKVAMLGLESKITEREQSGRTVFRVRVGPFDKQADADAAKEKLTASSIETVLVRIERPAR